MCMCMCYRWNFNDWACESTTESPCIFDIVVMLLSWMTTVCFWYEWEYVLSVYGLTWVFLLACLLVFIKWSIDSIFNIFICIIQLHCIKSIMRSHVCVYAGAICSGVRSDGFFHTVSRNTRFCVLALFQMFLPCCRKLHLIATCSALLCSALYFLFRFCGRTFNPQEADFFYLPIVRDVRKSLISEIICKP